MPRARVTQGIRGLQKSARPLARAFPWRAQAAKRWSAMARQKFFDSARSVRHSCTSAHYAVAITSNPRAARAYADS